ncbi:MAG: ATP-binding protein [bacterium]
MKVKTRSVRLSIRAKLFFAFIPIYFLLLGMIYLLSLRFVASFEEISQLRLRSALSGITTEFQRKVVTTRERVEAVSQDRALIERVIMYNFAPNNLINEVVRIKTATGLDVLKVISPRGTLLASGASRADFGRRVQNLDTIKSVLKNNTTVVIEKERVLNREFASLNVYYPIIYLGKPAAVLVGGSYIDLEYMKTLEDLSTARVMLYEGYRPVIGSGGVGGGNILTVDENFLYQLEKNPQSTEHIRAGREEYLVSGVPLAVEEHGETLGFFVLALSLRKESALVGVMRRDITYLAVVGLFITIIVGTLLSLGFTKPIGALVRAARRVGRGELDGIAVNVRSSDEIGLLGETFRRMARDLMEYRTRLVLTERTAAWRDIARRIAHEIKNPLSPIQLSMENLKRAFSEDRRRFERIFPECTDTILEEVDRLRRLAGEFSDFARMPLPRFEDVHLSEIIENAVQLYREISDKVKISVIKESSDQLVVRGDRDQLTQVFENLLKNSIEAMKGVGEIKVTVKEIDGRMVVIVEDNGPGIAREDLPKIFTSYYTTKDGGGLGLSIVHRILQDHGARIEVHSEAGVGTWFIITFPEPGTVSAANGGERTV